MSEFSLLLRRYIPLTHMSIHPEVVLCQLLTKFTFATSAKPVVWNLSGVRFPTVAEATKPSMPMMVGLYKEPGVAV